MSCEAIEAEIQEHLTCRSEPAARVEAAYYDTFDWAVYAGGGLLSHCGGRLHWTALSGSETCSQPLDGAPGLVGDLAPGPVRKRIPASADIRRLLPQIEIRSEGRLLHVVDEAGKMLARLWLCRYAFQDPASGREGTLPGRLGIDETQGRDDDREMLVALIEAKLRLIAAPLPPALEALRALGREPGGYTSKPDVRLDPRERADAAVSRMLLALLDILEANVAGARAGWDAEFLHDLRVATRRTRSVLGQLKGVFPEATVERFRADFAWVQQVTGPVRDLDVYLLAFEEYRSSLPPPLRQDLEPLRAYLRERHGRQQAELAETLGSARFRELLRDWRSFLEAPAPEPADPSAPNAARRIKAVADARIRRMAKRARREGRAIREESPAEELHELRKTCKKLRYLLELCGSLYPEAATKPLIKQLKLLLDQLGTFQDLAVQAGHLEDMAEQMHAEGRASPRTLLAMGALVGKLLERQAVARAGFAEAFAAFDDPQRWSQHKALLWGKASKAH